ncbi:Retrotransposon-derived protein PEG10 [Rhizoctonia solani]|uniref:Retrotransposon-derived protein PEG10 n=1 Tax=Rhizoctonia solani TaxID=456999 RepID=A0A8H8P3G3_9AGAM|nr:Retrotransposon-derived protein PEG10 [Rhizoctonia solani]QRW23108.1 Retrotransposon-derived protein PEG10 [Rhizoctonia solani]
MPRSSQRPLATRSQPPLAAHHPLRNTCPEWNRSRPLPLSSRLSTPSPAKSGPCRPKSTLKANSSELKAICKETNDLGPVTPPTHSGGEAHTPGTVRPGLKAPFRPSRGTGFDSEEEEEPRRPKKEPQGSNIKQPKMDLPDPYKGDTRGRKAPSGSINAFWVALHRDQFDEEEQMVAADWALPIIGTIIKGEGNPPTTIPALTAKFKEAFADPNAKRAAARKIAALTQSTTTAEYVTKFRNLMAELNWNTEAFIAQFTRGLHWKVKELLSTKDNIPDDDLEAIFAASIKIDIRWENEENRPKKTPAKSPATVATTSTTTTQRVRLSEDPNYVTPEERDRRRASGLCVKCGQKGHGIKQCPNGWKATIKEIAKVAEDESGKDEVEDCCQAPTRKMDNYPDSIEEEADTNPLADLPEQYHEFAKVFGKEEFKVLPPHREYDISMTLSLMLSSPGPIYGMTDAESKALNNISRRN